MENLLPHTKWTSPLPTKGKKRETSFSPNPCADWPLVTVSRPLIGLQGEYSPDRQLTDEDLKNAVSIHHRSEEHTSELQSR